MDGLFSYLINTIKLYQFRRKGVIFTSKKPLVKAGSSSIKISGNGTIKLGRAIINANTFLCSDSGKIIIEDSVSINRNTIIVSRESIVIKEGCSIGPNVCIYDHDHEYNGNGFRKDSFKTAQVIIGKNSWIGAGAIILKGSIIGDNCVVGAGCCVKGKIPDNTLVYDKRDRITKGLN